MKNTGYRVGSDCLICASIVTLFAACTGAPPSDVEPGDDPPPAPAEPLETQPLFNDPDGGNASADDPAIWIHPTDSAASLVIATKKDAGLSVFDMSGHEIQVVAPLPAPSAVDKPGRFNNADLLYGVKLAGRTVDLVAVTDRGYDRIRFFAIDSRGAAAAGSALVDVTATVAPVFSATQTEINKGKTAYGLAAWTDSAGTSFLIVSQASTTRLARLKVVDAGGGKVGYDVVSTLDLPSTFTLPDGTIWTPCTAPGKGPQSEGMVVDRETGTLYVGQEIVGIWRVSASSALVAPKLIEKTKSFGVPAVFNAVTKQCEVSGPDPGVGGRLAADVEGLSIYYRQDGGEGYLLVSSQGDNTFAAYHRSGNNDFIGRFTIGGDGIDTVEDCDGIDVTNAPAGRFGNGLVVFQDGKNEPPVLDAMGMPRDNTNFKFVPWETIATELDLEIEPDGWRPR